MESQSDSGNIGNEEINMSLPIVEVQDINSQNDRGNDAPLDAKQPTFIEGVLTAFYPIPSTVWCPEPDNIRCQWSSAAGLASGRKQSLVRHLKETHRLPVTSETNRCAVCNSHLGKRPSAHRCTEQRQVTDNVVEHHFICTWAGCQKKFPTSKGLQNHTYIHRKNEAQARRNANENIAVISENTASQSSIAPINSTPIHETSNAVEVLPEIDSTQLGQLSQISAAPANSPSQIDSVSSVEEPSTQTSNESLTPINAIYPPLYFSSDLPPNSQEPTYEMEDSIISFHYDDSDETSEGFLHQSVTEDESSLSQTITAVTPEINVSNSQFSMNTSRVGEEENGTLANINIQFSMNTTRVSEEENVTGAHTEINDQRHVTANDIEIPEQNANISDVQNLNAAADQDQNDATNELPETNEISQRSYENSQEDFDDVQDEIVGEENNQEQAQPSSYALYDFLAPLENQVRETNWEEFELLLDEITTAVQQHYGILRPNTSQMSNSPIDVEDCKTVQKLYRRNRRRAVRAILEGEPERCNIPRNEIEEHFKTLFERKEFDPEILENLPVCPEDRIFASTTPFSEQEILYRLRRAENSSPGSDKITYKHWKEIDPDCQALHLIFRVCMENRRIPSKWKSSRTILIPKSGAPEDIQNWRPISLCRTIYKLYTSCLVQRLRSWATNENIFSPEQKGFMPHDGVVEHNFALQYYLNEARTNQKEIHVALLDISNAFGSISTDLIIASLTKSGIGDDMIEILKDIMTGTSTRIATNNGETEPLEVNSGVRQGCPLSGYLFNAGIEPLLRGIVKIANIVSPTGNHHCLAYADDISLLATDHEVLQHLVTYTEESCSALNLSINPRKCKYIYWSGAQPVGTRSSSISIGDQAITSLEEFESTMFLGKPVGFNVLRQGERIDVAIEKAMKILNSKLAPWQRIDALRTFIIPSLIFPMRTWQYTKGQYDQFDKKIRPLIKKTLYLPARSANEYIYGSSKGGTCAVPITAEDSDLFLIDTAFKLLSSPDQIIKRIAESECASLGGRRSEERTDNPTAITEFFSNPQLARRSSAISSLWTKTRAASVRLNVKWHYQNDQYSLKFNDREILQDNRKEVASTIRMMKRAERDALLLEKPDQGKTFHCISADDSSSAFMKDGQFITFADWRFIHRGRLNLLPLNGVNRGRGASVNRGCRRCQRGTQETLPHVINHCGRHTAAIQKRHNEIVDRLKETALFLNWEIISENQNIPNSNLAGRPDLVIKKRDEAIIIDVACPFENGANAFEVIRELKKAKYAEHERFLRRSFTNVKIEPFIVGSLGTYDPKNSSLTRKISTRSYTKLMKKLCVTTCIKWSRMMYIEHLTGARQY